MADVELERGPANEPEPASDSHKRRQIIHGASKVFMSQGFMGASMGEIARVAEVSKGTLYVYFENKEQLFEACMEEKRRVHIGNILEFDAERPIDEELTRYGIALAQFVTTPPVIMAMRTVIGIAEQMPDLGRRFYDNGPGHSAQVFAQFLEGRVAAGVLSIPDTYLAAVQFSDMCQSTLVRPLLFGRAMTFDECRERISHVVATAVRTFMKAYAPGS